MAKKKFLDDVELEKESKKFRKNPVKQDAFKKFRNALLIQGLEFSPTWNEAIRYGRSYWNTARLKYNDSISKIALDLIEELVVRKSTSTLALVGEMKGKNKKQKLIDAEIKIYGLRLKNFLKKYGDNEFFYDGVKTTLKEQFEIYASKTDETYNKNKMNDIIDTFKHNDGQYLLAEQNGNYGKND